MNSMKKGLLTFLLILSVALTACGAEENGTTEEADTAQEQAQTETEEPEEEPEDDGEEGEEKELLVYSGAGLKKSMEEIKGAFEEEHPEVRLNMIYAGSGQLLAQLEESGKGDVFIVGSKPTFDDAAEKGLTNEGVPVAHHTPCIVVQKGNPLDIEGLEDLARDDVKLALGDPEANAIGKTAVKIFEKNGLEELSDKAVVKTGTVNELYLAMEAGNADAAVVTKDGAFNNQDTVEIIDIPEDENVDQIITASSLKTSEQEDITDLFVEFLTSDEAVSSWEEHGFEAVKE